MLARDWKLGSVEGLESFMERAKMAKEYGADKDLNDVDL